ncbi:hypothetical protein KHM83_09405 [Fusibacter paucivorans]|uniref:Uncharacterized protein n=1 Tax=Fusibacter paucivorans TaxID=76009 RepID=A0ABS5PPA1_9FIRM|nr:hypothetical protein [Fusibacter paucivorans]MBS7526893.1 hypothetical protein [Fusibacter paucivorans]
MKSIKQFESKRNRVYLMQDALKKCLYVEKHFADETAYRFEKDVYIRIGASTSQKLIPEILSYSDDEWICRYAYIEGMTVLAYLERCETLGDEKAATALLHQLFEWLIAFYCVYDEATNVSSGSAALADLNLKNFVFANDGRVFGIDFEEMAYENRMVSMIRLIAMYRQYAPTDSLFKQAAVRAFLTESTLEQLGEIGNVDLTALMYDAIYRSEVARIQHRRDGKRLSIRR